jgi:ATP/ADP translocase
MSSLTVALGLVLLEWGLTFSYPRVAAVLVHLHVAVFGATLLSAFWSMVNERFDPYTAKRVMGRIGLGAAMGGIVGGGFAWLSARSLSVPSMLLSVALLDTLALAGLRRLPRRPPSLGEPLPTATPSAVRLGDALRVLREGSYFRHLALIVALSALLESLLDFTFNAKAAETLRAGADLASFFALYQVGVSLLGFLAQGLLTRPSLEGLGLAGTVGVRPLVVAVSALLGLLDPRLWSLLLARGSHAVLTTSLFRSSY